MKSCSTSSIDTSLDETPPVLVQRDPRLVDDPNGVRLAALPPSQEQVRRRQCRLEERGGFGVVGDLGPDVGRDTLALLDRGGVANRRRLGFVGLAHQVDRDERISRAQLPRRGTRVVLVLSPRAVVAQELLEPREERTSILAAVRLEPVEH